MGDSSRLRRSAALQRLAIRPSGGVAALLVAYLVLACAYGVVTPVFEAADEHTHYFYAQYVGRARRLPVQSTGNGQPSGPWEQEGSQPPLYYLLVAPLVAVSGSDITSEDLLYNHQNTMGHPALVGNENRFVHPADREGWPWQGYSLGVHLARSVSTLLGLIGVLASLALARAVFVERPWLAVVSAAVVALSPQFLHVTSSVSNDPAIAALAALALWLTIRVVDGHDEAPSVVALAVVTGLAPLAKLSGAMLALFVLGSLAAVAWRRRDRAFLLRTALPVALALVVLSGWWYARNLRLYGSLTGLEAMLGQQLSREMRPARWLRGLPAELWGVWLSYWGLFGWFTVMLPGWAYALCTAGVAAGLLGALAAWRRRAPWLRWGQLAWLMAWALLVVASLLRWMMLTKGGAGRLLFPAASSLAIAVVTGWRHLLRRPDDRGLAGGVMVAMVALSAYALVGVIAPAYAGPQAIAADAVPANAQRTDVAFGPMHLVAYQHQGRAREGSTLAVTLYWRIDRPVERDGFVALRLDQSVGRGPPAGGRLEVPGAASLSYPGAGNAPPWMLAPGPQIYVDRHLLAVPALAPQPDLEQWVALIAPDDRRGGSEARQPIAAQLTVHMYDQSRAESWPAAEPPLAGSGSPPAPRTAAFASLGQVVIDPAPGRRRIDASDSLRPVAAFASDIWLLAGSPMAIDGQATALAPTAGPPVGSTPAAASRSAPPTIRARAGAEVVLPVEWDSDRAPGEDLTMFVHLVSESGALAAQADGPPATHGEYPTSDWLAGDRLGAMIRIRLPADARLGTRFRLRLGLYRPVAGSPRIAADTAEGQPWPDDAAALADLVIGP